MRVRFLRARDLKVKKAAKMLRQHMEWRDRIKPESITAADLPNSLPSGCFRFLGISKDKEPIMIIRVSLWNPQDFSLEEYVKNVAWIGELSYKMMAPGISKWIVLIDLKGWALWHAKYISYVKQLISITQDQNPERLSSVYLMHAGWLFSGAWKVIRPWMDKNTAAKVHFLGSQMQVRRLGYIY